VNLRRWLTVGIGVKRWLLVSFAGLLVLALGVAHTLRQATRDLEPGGPLQVVIDTLTLRFLPYELRGLIAGLVGLGLFAYGAYRVVRALMEPFGPWDGDRPLIEVIYQKRFLSRGPRIVAIGGGTGLSMLLRGLKHHTSNLTAVVTVADDGGSSGLLRSELGIPAVGDIRNCLVALADSEPLMGRLLQYRFPGPLAAAPLRDGGRPGTPTGTVVVASRDAETPATGLSGHAVGNLLIAALVALEAGDFEEAVREMNRVLAVRGQVVPATATPITLRARLEDGSEVSGQSRIGRTTRVDTVWVTPQDVVPCEDALRAIGEAELIVMGPGSLFTSLLPALLVPGIREAIAATPALTMFVSNVATQEGETEHFDLADHVDALGRHAAAHLVDVVLANNKFDARTPSGYPGQPVRLRWPPAGIRAPKLVLDDVVDPDNAHHHDPARLATAIIRVWDREGGSRRRGAVARSA
jgi:uncharacterized cofD-like protein